MVKKSCGNCVNCIKHIGSNKELWSCENYDKSVGMPVQVSPPYDDACSNWSNNPKDIDKASDALRYYVDHFWDDKEEYE